MPYTRLPQYNSFYKTLGRKRGGYICYIRKSGAVRTQLVEIVAKN